MSSNTTAHTSSPFFITMAIFSPSNRSVGEGGSNITEKSHTLDFTVLGNEEMIKSYKHIATSIPK
jgi:hypothetical protein